MIHCSARQTKNIIVIYINNTVTHNCNVNDLQDIFNGKTFKISFLLNVMHDNGRSNGKKPLLSRVNQSLSHRGPKVESSGKENYWLHLK
jgi:hypothetical protein